MNTQTKVAIIAIAAVITLASLAVSQTNFNFETSTADDSKLQLVTSASFLHEFSQSIGKEKIDSTLLYRWESILMIGSLLLETQKK